MRFEMGVFANANGSHEEIDPQVLSFALLVDDAAHDRKSDEMIAKSCSIIFHDRALLYCSVLKSRKTPSRFQIAIV